MFRTLIDCSRLMLDSPWLMLLAFVVVALPGGLLMMPLLASRLRRAKAATSAQGNVLVEPVVNNESYLKRASSAKSDFISFVPSVGKLN